MEIVSLASGSRLAYADIFAFACLLFCCRYQPSRKHSSFYTI